MFLKPSLVIPVIGVALLLAGCSHPKTDGLVEIVYWTGWSGHEYDAQIELIGEFNRTHPGIRVRMLTQFNSTGTYQKVRIAIAGGATPDVMSTVWPDELAGYAMRGVLTPLEGYMARTGRDIDRDFTPGIAHMVKIDGHVYGLTVTTNANFIAYNKQVYKDSGLDPERPPRSADELLAASRACLKKDSSGEILRYGFRPLNLDLWAYVFGGSWYDPATGRVTANDPHSVAALRWMASFNQIADLKKIAAFQTTYGSNESANGPFFTGKMTMWQTGEWSAEFIRRYAPNLKWGWFALPPPTGGRQNTTNAGGSVFVIPAACKHKEEAWQFLNWISSRHAVTAFCSKIHNVPPLIESGRQPVFQNDPLMKFAVQLSQGSNSFGVPPIPIWSTYKREIQRAEDQATLGGGDPQQLLDAVQMKMDRELKRTMEELR